MDKWSRRLRNETESMEEGERGLTWVRCDRCLTVLEPGDIRGERGGEVLCAECADEVWGELTDEEKLERLGYEVVG